ncbi:MAG: hypothetical protein H3C38_15180 [Rhodospirillales bacterium]|nr:hypothetical protein [Rhodospirillales bacterium]
MTQERDREDGTAKDGETTAEHQTAPAEAEAPAAEEAAAPAAEAGAETERPSEAEPAVAGGEPRTQGSGLLAGLIASAVVAILVVGAVAVAAPLWAPRLAGLAGLAAAERVAAVEAGTADLRQDLARLSARMDDFESALTGLRGELTALDGAAGAPSAGADVQDLARRIAVLEEQAQASGKGPTSETVASLASDAERLGRELAELRESVETLRKTAADAGAVLRLSQRVEAAETAAREAAAQRGSAQALLLAVGQLREAVNRGEPFAAELRALGAILDGDDAAGGELEKLARHAAQGIPTRSRLIAAFPDLAGRIVRAGLGPDRDGWWRQTVQRLASLVTIRRTEGEAADRSTAAVVARAEAKLATGDLAGAVAELGALEGPALETAGPWMADARARVAADRALSDLTSEAVAVTARGEG